MEKRMKEIMVHKGGIRCPFCGNGEMLIVEQRKGTGDGSEFESVDSLYGCTVCKKTMNTTDLKIHCSMV
jgi:DNA-directed RNA polymerase subunit RPC12/RpoP